jgi:hypothetical protein
VATDKAAVLFPDAQSEISALAAPSAVGWGADGMGTVVLVVVGTVVLVDGVVADVVDFCESAGLVEHAARAAAHVSPKRARPAKPEPLRFEADRPMATMLAEKGDLKIDRICGAEKIIPATSQTGLRNPLIAALPPSADLMGESPGGHDRGRRHHVRPL